MVHYNSVQENPNHQKHNQTQDTHFNYSCWHLILIVTVLFFVQSQCNPLCHVAQKQALPLPQSRKSQCINLEHWAEPNWESTHAVTSLGSDKLVVPEEKMADHEEPLSDEEKVRC